MFFAILFIAVGLAILLSTLGLINGTFWGFFWALFFLAIGFKMMMKKGKCPVCGLGMWKNGIHQKIHAKMHNGSSCCENGECECDEDDCICECEEKNG